MVSLGVCSVGVVSQVRRADQESDLGVAHRFLRALTMLTMKGPCGAGQSSSRVGCRQIGKRGIDAGNEEQGTSLPAPSLPPSMVGIVL